MAVAGLLAAGPLARPLRRHTGSVRHRVLPSVILASVALALTVAITVGWNVIFATHYATAFGDEHGQASKTGYWLLMAIGDLFLATVMTAIAIVLAVTIRRSRRLHEQNAFIDRVTHELRTPITALRLALDTCLRRRLDADTLRDQIGDMRSDLDRLEGLVDKVIDTGRLEHHSWRLRREPLDPADLVATCCGRIRDRHLLASDAIAITGRARSIVSDPLAVEHILINLLDNAVKYGDGSGVSVAVTDIDGGVAIAVTDRGVGISRREQGRIFRRFHRVDARHGTGGAGLGLYVVDHLCRQLGGRIRVHSDGLGRGARFTLTLPLEPR